MSDFGVPVDWLPLFIWRKFFYKQQDEFTLSGEREVWFIGGNGTGKTLVLYANLAMQLLGIHPKQLGPPPITIRVLVPSFDNVEKTALEKLLSHQRVVYSELNEEQQQWVAYGESIGAIKGHKKGKGFDIGPLLPQSMLISERGFKKEHRGIELVNGSKMWWVTTEQGWMSMRGAEQDIEAVDEESGWDEFNQVKRGLRNAKGGGRIYGALTPPYKEGQGPTWTKEKVVDAAAEDDEIRVINACMADNPAIKPEYIEWWKKGKTQKQVDVEVYGKYPAWGDLVHPDYQDRLWDSSKVDGHLIKNDVELPNRSDVDWVMAFDWHQSKPCAAVFGYISSDGNITIFDEMDRELADGKQINELADLFRSIEGEPHAQRKFRRWQDPSAKSRYNAVERGFNAWDAFRKAGIVTSVGKNRDPEVGISIVNQYFRGNGKDHPRIFIYERCKYTRQYLTNHYWKRGEDGKATPDPKWSDYPVCLKYLCQEFGRSAMKGRRSKWPLTSYGDVGPKPKTIDLSRWI